MCPPARRIFCGGSRKGRSGNAMANDVQYLIDMLYEMIDGAKGVA